MLKLLIFLINCWIKVGVIINKICGKVIDWKIWNLFVLLILVVLICFVGKFMMILVVISIVIGILIYILIKMIENFV